MHINATEITDILKDNIKNFTEVDNMDEVGQVISISDGIAQVYGLRNVALGELVEFSDGSTGMALNLEEDRVGVITFSTGSNISSGDTVKRTKREVSVPVGKGLLGRVIDIMGNPIDGKGPITGDVKMQAVEVKAPGIMTRKSVHEPMQTGLKSIDALVPIGRGQRELIIGDRQTDKSAIILDCFINQKSSNDQAKDDSEKMFCIYVAIGQKRSTVASIIRTLEEKGAVEYSIIIAATASDPASAQYIAPYVGFGLNAPVYKNIGVFGEVGAYYTGNPDVKLDAYNLKAVTGAKPIDQAVADEQDKIANKGSYEWMPVGKVGVSFKF